MATSYTEYFQQVLLADDDQDDCLLFKDALDELSLPVNFTTVRDGEQLMKRLSQTNLPLPDILFLDLNMPRKNGLQCIIAIKQDIRLKQLPVIIFSTSYEQDAVDILYNNGAQHYIRKPNEFSRLKLVIEQALFLITSAQSLASQNGNITQPPKEEFVL